LTLCKASVGLLALGVERRTLFVELALANGDGLELLGPAGGRLGVVVAGRLELGATLVDVLRQASKADLVGGDRRSGLGELGPLALYLLESSPELRVALAELLFGCRDAIGALCQLRTGALVPGAEGFELALVRLDLVLELLAELELTPRKG